MGWTVHRPHTSAGKVVLTCPDWPWAHPASTTGTGVIARMPIFSTLWCLAVWDVLIWAHVLRQVLFNKHMIKWVNVQLYKLSPALARKLVFHQSLPELHRTVHLSYPWTLVHKVLACLQLPNKTAVLSPLQSTPGYTCSVTFVSCTDTLFFLATCKTRGCKVLWSLLPQKQ
jgi:hypothetical protein